MSSIHTLIRKYGGNTKDCFLSARLAPGACELNETLPEKASRPSQGAHEHQKISVRLDNLLHLKNGDLPTEVLTALKKTLTFDNPLFLREKRFGKVPLKAQPHLFGFWEKEDGLVLVRGFANELFRILNAHRILFDLKDETRRLEQVDFTFSGSLNHRQAQAAQAAAEQRFGIIAGPPGSGKKVLASKLICGRRIPALIIVKTRARMYAWRNAAGRFLGIEDQSIGLIGDGFKRVGGKLTVAIDRSLYRMVDEIKKSVGFLIVDRCHTANLKIFFKAISSFDCPFMLGLSTSVERPDGLTKLMMAYLGPLVAEIRPVETPNGSEGSRPQALIRRTAFVFDYRENYGDLISALCADQKRNRLIAADILQEIATRGGLSLVISERIEHLKILQRLLAASFVKSEMLTSLTSASERHKMFNRIGQKKLLVVLMTAKGIPDCNIHSVGALFVASPLRSWEHLMLMLGKLVSDNKRKSPGSIYDYLDEPAVLKASLNGRLKAYRSIGAVLGR